MPDKMKAVACQRISSKVEETPSMDRQCAAGVRLIFEAASSYRAGNPSEPQSFLRYLRSRGHVIVADAPERLWRAESMERLLQAFEWRKKR